MALKSPSGRAGSPHTAQAFRQHRTPSPARLTEPQASDKRGGSTVKAGSLAPRAGCGKAVPPGQELRVTAQNLLAWQGAEPGTRGQERGGGRVRARVGRDGPEPRWNPEAPPRVHWPGAAAARRQEALAGSSPHPGPAGLGVSASKTPASSAFPHAIHSLRAADDSACSAGTGDRRRGGLRRGRRDEGPTSPQQGPAQPIERRRIVLPGSEQFSCSVQRTILQKVHIMK